MTHYSIQRRNEFYSIKFATNDKYACKYRQRLIKLICAVAINLLHSFK